MTISGVVVTISNRPWILVEVTISNRPILVYTVETGAVETGAEEAGAGDVGVIHQHSMAQCSGMYLTNYLLYMQSASLLPLLFVVSC